MSDDRERPEDPEEERPSWAPFGMGDDPAPEKPPEPPLWSGGDPPQRPGGFQPPKPPPIGDLGWPPPAPSSEPQPQPPAQQQSWPTTTGRPPTASGATAALVLGAIGIFVCPLVCSVAAIVLGVRARREIDASGGALGGRGSATAGLWLGVIGLFFFVAVLSVYLGSGSI